MKGYEIFKVANGFLVRKAADQSRTQVFENPWVFESFEALTKFLEKRFKEDYGVCGSCGGDGILK